MFIFLFSLTVFSGRYRLGLATEKAKTADSTSNVAKPTEARASILETAMPVLSKKTFDKLPQWDFEDVYNQDATPTHSVSRFAQNSTEKMSVNFMGAGNDLWCFYSGSQL